MNKKKILIFSLLIIATLIFALMILSPSKYGSYNLFTGHITCDNRDECLHEAAHKYDDEMGYISKTTEFKSAVNTYRAVLYLVPSEDYKTDLFDYYIVFFPGVGAPRLPEKNITKNSFWQGGWGGYTELYASIVEYANGDINQIPESLRGFYDMEEINEIMKGLNYAD